MQPHPACGIGWYGQLADADRRQTTFFAKALLCIRSSSSPDIGSRADGQAKHLGGKRRIRLLAEPHQQWNPTYHMVPLDGLIQESIAGGSGFELWQVRYHRRKAVDMAERFVPSEGKSRLWYRRSRLAVISQDKTGYDRHGANRLRQLAIGIGKRCQQPLRLPHADPVLSEQRQQQFGSRAIRFGEIDVESDD